MLSFLLENFWFVGAGVALANIPVYAHAVRIRKLGRSDEARVFRCFVLICCLIATSSAAIGVSHIIAGHTVPIVPFVSPLSELPGVRVSWALVVGSVLAIVAFINTRHERVSAEIAEILVANFLRGRAALRAINLLGMGAVILALGTSVLVGWRG